MTQYTACFSIRTPVDLSLLDEECRILTGSSPANIEKHDDPFLLNFTLTDMVGDGGDPDEYFDQIGRDLTRFLKVHVNLDEIFIDD